MLLTNIDILSMFCLLKDMPRQSLMKIETEEIRTFFFHLFILLKTFCSNLIARVKFLCVFFHIILHIF